MEKSTHAVVWLPSPSEQGYEGDWLEENFVSNYYSSSSYCMEEEDKTELLFPAQEQIVSFVQESSLLLLDVGCGRNGSLSHVNWKPRSVPLLWLGLDTSANAVYHFQQVARNSNFIVEGMVASAYALPFRENIFDTILCQSVLHHCPTAYKRQLIWENIYAACLLKPPFCIYLTVCAFEQTNRRLASQDALVPDKNGRLVYYHFFTRQQLQKELTHGVLITERDQHALLLFVLEENGRR